MATLPGASPVPTAVPPSTKAGGLTYRGLLFQILSQKPDASPDEIVSKLDQLTPQMTPQDRLEWQKHRARFEGATLPERLNSAGKRLSTNIEDQRGIDSGNAFDKRPDPSIMQGRLDPTYSDATFRYPRAELSGMDQMLGKGTLPYVSPTAEESQLTPEQRQSMPVGRDDPNFGKEATKGTPKKVRVKVRYRYYDPVTGQLYDDDVVKDNPQYKGGYSGSDS